MDLFRKGKNGEQARGKPPRFLKFRSSKGYIVSVVSMSIFTDIFLYSVIIPVIPFALQTRIGVPYEDLQYWVSILLAVYAAGLLAFSPIWGWFADYTSSRGPPFLLGLVALMGATALLCVGSSLAVLAVGRMLQGISAALVWSVGLAIVSDTVGGSNKLGEAMGWISLGMGLAVFIGPLLGGIVFARAGYYAVFGMCFGVVGLDIVMRLFMIEVKVARRYLPAEDVPSGEESGAGIPGAEHDETKESPPEPEKEVPTEPAAAPTTDSIAPPTKRKLPAILVLLSTPRLLAGLWGTLVMAILLTAFEAVIPLYVNRIFGWDSTGAGLIFIALCVPTFFEPLIGKLGDRVGVRWVVVGGFAMALPFYVFLRFVTYDDIHQKVLLAALLFLIGLSISCVLPPLLAETTYIVTDKEKAEPGIFGKKSAYAQAYGLFNVAYAGGTLIGPLWGGFVNQTAGWGTMGWSLGLLSGLTTIPAAIYTGGSPLERRRRREEAKAAADSSEERRPSGEASEVAA